MSLFAIGDLHLSFGEGIDKPMDVFGPSWKNYELRLKEAWLDLIRPEDTVIIPGDISWAMSLEEASADFEWIAALPGEKIIFKGNHDLWWSSHKKLNSIDPTLHFLQNESYDGKDFTVIGSRGWLCPGSRDFAESTDRKIYERELARLELSAADAEKKGILGDGRPVIGALHYPPTNEKKQSSGFTEFFSKYSARCVVYGHLHGDAAFMNGPSETIGGCRYYLCSLDKLQCIPKKILDI